MHLYEILLGVDRAARDSGRRMTMTVCERDPLSAAIAAEGMADRELRSPVEYSHAMQVKCLRRGVAAKPLASLVPAAA